MRKKILNRLMPEYFSNMPDEKRGKYQVQTYRLTPELGLVRGLVTYDRIFFSLRKAYKYVRIRALIRDILSRPTMGEGIGYAVINISKGKT